MPYAAILFDLDGTLIDTDTLYRQVNARVLGDYGISLVEDDFSDFYHRGIGVLDEWIARTGRSAEDQKDIRRIMVDACQKALRTGATLYADVHPVLDALRENVPHGVVTTSFHTDIDAIHENSLIRDHLPIIVTGDDTHGRHKPDPYPLILAAERLKVDPATCIYVGDLPTDVMAAEAAGMGSCIVKRRHTPKQATAKHVIESLAEVLELAFSGHP